MEKLFGVIRDAITNKISVIQLKKKVKEYANLLKEMKEKLKTIDPVEFEKIFYKRLLNGIDNAYAKGIISEEEVERARRMSVIFPGEISETAYKTAKLMFELAKKRSDDKGKKE
jgi:hypothetical protein